MEPTVITDTSKPHPIGLRIFAKVISYIFHPALMPTLMMLVFFRLLPASFASSTPTFMRFFLPVFVCTAFLPIVGTLLTRGVGFIESIHMHNSKDRIIPLIISMTCYFWINHVMDNLHAPLIVHTLTLGAFWGIIAIFMINIFFKISMHTVAAGGVLGLFIVLIIISSVNLILPFFIALVFAGLVGTARMILRAHTNAEIWLGYIVGIMVQLGAYWYLA